MSGNKVSFPSSIPPLASAMQCMDGEVDQPPVDHLSESSLATSKSCSCFQPILDFFSCLWESLKSLFRCCLGATKSETDTDNVAYVNIEDALKATIDYGFANVFDGENRKFSNAIIAIFIDPNRPHIIYPYDKFNRSEFTADFLKEYTLYMQVCLYANREPARTHPAVCTIGQKGKQFHCFTSENEEIEKVFNENQISEFNAYLDGLFGQQVRKELICTCSTVGENPKHTIMLNPKPYVSDGVSHSSVS